jgi:hypothetical protein
MFSRLFRLSALAVLLAVPAAGAQETKKDSPRPAGPSVVVRVPAINDLLAAAKYIRTFVPGDQGNELELGLGAAEAFIDNDKGSIEGIDVKSPIGLYVTFGEELNATPPVVVLIPVADQDAVLNALKNRAQLQVEKEKDDVYKTQPPQSPFPIYFRFANKYAYVTINDPQNIDPKTLPKPEAVLGGGKPEQLISASLRIDRLPDGMKKMALGFIEMQLAKGKDQPVPNETKAIKDLKDKAIDELSTNLKSLLDGGQELALRLNVDPKADEVSLELELTGQPGSKLAKDIASIRQNKSAAGGAVASPDAAFNFNLSTALAAGLRQMLPTAVDDALAAAKKEANAPGEIQTKVEPLIKALLPTVKAGELDLAAALVGPDKDNHYTFVAALKVVDGKKIEATVKDIVKKELPPEMSGLIQFDADKLPGGASLHTVKVADHLKDGEKVLGKNDLHVTFRDDLVIAAIGPGAKDALRRAVTSQPADVGVLQFQVSLARIVPIMGDNAGELAAARAAAEKVFGKGGSGADTVRFSIEGGDSLKVKFGAKGKAIQFLAEVGAAQQKKDQ